MMHNKKTILILISTYFRSNPASSIGWVRAEQNTRFSVSLTILSYNVWFILGTNNTRVCISI